MTYNKKPNKIYITKESIWWEIYVHGDNAMRIVVYRQDDILDVLSIIATTDSLTQRYNELLSGIYLNIDTSYPNCTSRLAHEHGFKIR